MNIYKYRGKGSNKLMHIIISILVLIIFFLWQNNHIVLSKHKYKNKKVPKEFDGFKIVHISDLHNKSFGKNQDYLLKKIESTKANIIVVTGDLIDRRRYDLDTSLRFIEGAIKIAPIYYVPGNHEAWSGQYEKMRKELIKRGVTVLDNERVGITIGNRDIDIIGLKDPAFYTSSYFEELDTRQLAKELEDLNSSENFKILLSHRPELIDIYASENIDMIFSGHAHGGQFRLPGLGGLLAPDQGFFPKYTSGSHKLAGSTLYISRGLGNSIVPIRIFNRPEIILVTISNQ